VNRPKPPASEVTYSYRDVYLGALAIKARAWTGSNRVPLAHVARDIEMHELFWSSTEGGAL
jgi:hypothetical protein